MTSLATRESPSCSVVRAPDRCTGGHGFDSRRGLRFFLCPTLATNWIFHLCHFFPSLKFTIFLSLLSHTVLSTLLILAVCRTRVTTNSVNMTSLATCLPVAQWLERPTGVREVMGSIPVGDSDFFLYPTLATNWIFHLSHFKNVLDLVGLFGHYQGRNIIQNGWLVIRDLSHSIFFLPHLELLVDIPLFVCLFVSKWPLRHVLCSSSVAFLSGKVLEGKEFTYPQFKTVFAKR